MTAYVYYRNENEEFKEDFARSLANSEACKIVINKLLKHYKLGSISINFTSGRNHSCAGKWQITINKEQMNFAVICHELAHVYQARKEGFERGDHWHTKVHRRIMKRMLAYCKKKNYFSEELTRRLAPKPIAPEPTKEELTDNRITRLKNNLARYEKKVKMYQNKIVKANKKLTRLLRIKS